MTKEETRYLREDLYDASRRLTPAGSKVVGTPAKSRCPATGLVLCPMTRKAWDGLLRRPPKWARFEVTELPASAIGVVGELEWSAAAEPMTEDVLRAMVKGVGGVLLASAGGNPSGHLIYTNDPRWATIDRLLVQPGLRRRGCATALVNALRTRESRRRGWIRTWVADDAAFLEVHQTLKALGFIGAPDPDTEGVLRFGRREAPDLVLGAGAEADLKLLHSGKKERSS